MDKQPRPIWENTLNTLDADPPANKIARQRRKLPAGNFVPGRNGWLCHVSFGLGHLGFEHVVVTTTWVPTWYTSTCGLSSLQLRQKPNNRSNWVRNTMCFGSVRRFVPFAEILQQKQPLPITSCYFFLLQLWNALKPGVSIPLLKWVPVIADRVSLMSIETLYKWSKQWPPK